MANSIVSALNRWFLHLPPGCVPWLPSGPNNLIWQLHLLINDAFVSQNYIGWGHLLRGCLSLHWKRCIAEYYKVCQPGNKFNPNLWMQKRLYIMASISNHMAHSKWWIVQQRLWRAICDSPHNDLRWSF
jgi:hypothetical protein